MAMLAKNLNKFKLVTFDCTNTLLYFKNPPEIQYLKTAATFGIPEENFDKNAMKVNFRKQFKELHMKYPNFGRDSIDYKNWWKQLVTNVFMQSSREPLDPVALEPIATKLIQQFQTRECWEKFQRSDELITALKDAGKVVGVISNFDPRLHALLADMNLTQFDFVLTSYETGVEKPNPKIFQRALEAAKLDIRPSEALHIGNEVDKDFVGAKSASWSAVLINSDTTETPRFNDVQHFWDELTSNDVKL